jgi:hypothetical protein
MPHRSTGRHAADVGAARHDRCRAGAGRGTRVGCLRAMDERVAAAIRRGGVSRGTALALHGAAVEAHPDDPCAARDRLEDLLAGVATD